MFHQCFTSDVILSDVILSDSPVQSAPKGAISMGEGGGAKANPAPSAGEPRKNMGAEIQNLSSPYIPADDDRSPFGESWFLGVTLPK